MKSNQVVFEMEDSKLKNIKDYLIPDQHDQISTDYYEALNHEDFESANAALIALESELRGQNIPAENSLLDGLDEPLTLHRLGVSIKLWSHF